MYYAVVYWNSLLVVVAVKGVNFVLRSRSDKIKYEGAGSFDKAMEQNDSTDFIDYDDILSSEPTYF